jgi:DNA-binding transcriptional LysR family regulator
MNLRHLRTFAAIVEDGGIGRAAGRLHLTQPTASRQIQELEDQLGVRLFDRVGRRVQLTAEGEELLVLGRRLLSDAESLAERARAMKGGHVGVLRIGTTPQTIESLLVGFLKRYQPHHPGVEIRLVEDGGVRLPERLERGDMQVAIMPEGDDRFHSRPLYPVHLTAVMQEGDRLARRRTVEVSELGNHTLLLLARNFASREWFNTVCQAVRARPRVFLESAAPDTLIALAAGGYGLAVVPTSVSIPSSAVRAVPLVHRGSAIGRWTVVAWHPRRFLPVYAQQFVEELVRHAKTTYPNRQLTRRGPRLPRPKPRSS